VRPVDHSALLVASRRMISVAIRRHSGRVPDTTNPSFLTLTGSGAVHFAVVQQHGCLHARMRSRLEEKIDEMVRIHHACWQHGCDMAACSACAAAGQDAACLWAEVMLLRQLLAQAVARCVPRCTG
jgi:hypothetical protein